MQQKLIVGLFVLCAVLIPFCSVSLIEEEIVDNGRTHEVEYVGNSVRPEDVQRAKGANGGGGGAGGGPASIVRQPPARKGEAAPCKMATLLSTAMAICSSFYLILVFLI